MLCLLACADEAAVTTGRQSLPTKGVEQEAAVILPLGALYELGRGKGSTCHHLPPLAVPRHNRPRQEQPVSLSQDTLVQSQFTDLHHQQEKWGNPAGRSFQSFDSLLKRCHWSLDLMWVDSLTSSCTVVSFCGSQLSEEQAQMLLERRTVVTLSIPLFTRNIWKNNFLQAALGAELRLQGCSGSALDALNALGLCQNKDTVRLRLHRLRNSKKTVSTAVLQRSIPVHSLFCGPYVKPFKPRKTCTLDVAVPAAMTSITSTNTLNNCIYPTKNFFMLF